MRLLKFPVAVWEDADGCFTAKTLDGEPAVAVDVTVAGAISQLKKYLRWRLGQDGSAGVPDMQDLRRIDLRIRVRPQYRTERSVFPCRQAITLRVPTVVGRRKDHSAVCSAPTVGLHLSSVSEEVLDELCRETLQRQMSGLSPADLSRCLPPKQLMLHSINVKSTPRKHRISEAYLPSVRMVAEALGERSLRKRYGRAWRRDREIARLVERLDMGGTSLILLGDSGCGKTTLLANAVRQLERKNGKDDAARVESRHRFWLTNGPRLIAGMQYLGQWEERCEALIDELADIGGALCVENLLELVHHGGSEPGGSVAAFLAPYIANRELRVVGEATKDELDACRRLLPEFASLFEVVAVSAFSPDESQAVLTDLLSDVSRQRHITVEEGVAQQTYRLFQRFMPYHSFPGKTTSFLNELLERPTTQELSRKDVDDQFQRLSGLRDALMKDDVPLAHGTVLGWLESRLFGQRSACDAAASVVTRFKAGLNDPNRPLGVLLFCGPTGVGKTELAKMLAQYLFGAGKAGTSKRLIRLDMSEYSGHGAADRLMMRPDGRPSELVEQVRLQPFALVLLDEIEKASPHVFDALLSVLDEGRLTDRWGRTTIFRSAVIIMTSNLGTSSSETLGFTSQSPAYEREVFSAFRPEFFNRIDSVVTFQPLSRETILAITRKELKDLCSREGLVKANIRLTFSDELINHLAEVGFDARLGARPLQRTIEQRVVAPLARFLVGHQSEGERVVRLELDDGRVVVR